MATPTKSGASPARSTTARDLGSLGRAHLGEQNLKDVRRVEAHAVDVAELLAHAALPAASVLGRADHEQRGASAEVAGAAHLLVERAPEGLVPLQVDGRGGRTTTDATTLPNTISSPGRASTRCTRWPSCGGSLSRGVANYCSASAAFTTLEDLELEVVQSSRDAFGARVMATEVQGGRVSIDLIRDADRLTRIGIRVGRFGDESKARFILAKIQERL